MLSLKAGNTQRSLEIAGVLFHKANGLRHETHFMYTSFMLAGEDASVVLHVQSRACNSLTKAPDEQASQKEWLIDP